jgi:hypothetical protein
MSASASGSVLDPLDLFSGRGCARGYEPQAVGYTITFDLGSIDGSKIGFVNGTIAATIVEEEDILDSGLRQLVVDNYDSGFIDGKKSGFTDRALRDQVTDEPEELNCLPTSIDNFDSGFLAGKISGFSSGISANQLSLDIEELTEVLSLSPIIFISGGYFTQLGTFMAKSQFVSTEDLQVVFPPFINRTDGTQFLGTDVVTLVVKKPNGILLSSPPVPTFDSDVKLWIATIPQASFLEGKWLILASSNGVSTQGQNQVLTWGDYVDDIQETRQAALGRWRIDSTTKKLLLYEDDGVTVFKTYDLKDSLGSPSVTQIFERTPE